MARKDSLLMRVFSIAFAVVLVMGVIPSTPAVATDMSNDQTNSAQAAPKAATSTETTPTPQAKPAAKATPATGLLGTLGGAMGIMPTSAPLSGFDVTQPFGGPGGSIESGDTGSVVVLGANVYNVYPGTAAGLDSAVAYLSNAPDGDYELYIGTNVTMSATSGTTLATLSNIGTLVITGSSSDPVPNPQTPALSTAVPARTLTLPSTTNFGCNIILRNISYATTNIYMNGYDLTLGNQSWATGGTNNYYGGGASGTINSHNDATGNSTTQMTIWSTGTGAANFYGGMNVGTLNGNVAMTFNNTSNGGAIDIFGGGYGSSATNSANVNGNVTTTINGMNTTSGGLDQFSGGVRYGNITGQVTNTISGSGRCNTSGTGNTIASTGTFMGGTFNGNIGSTPAAADPQTLLAKQTSNVLPADYAAPLISDTDYAIKNNIDFSGYTSGSMFFIGANDTAGVVTGNVINVAKAGDYTNGGYITGFQGGGGWNTRIGGSWATTSNFGVNASSTGLTITNADAGFAGAKAAASFQLYGNITNILRSGCFSLGGSSYYLRGAGEAAMCRATPSLTSERKVWSIRLLITNMLTIQELQRLKTIKAMTLPSIWSAAAVMKLTILVSARSATAILRLLTLSVVGPTAVTSVAARRATVIASPGAATSTPTKVQDISLLSMSGTVVQSCTPARSTGSCLAVVGAITISSVTPQSRFMTRRH